MPLHFGTWNGGASGQSGPVVTAYQLAVLAASPLFYWGENLATLIGDIDLAFVGAPSEVAGLAGKALQFDGVLDTAKTSAAIDFTDRTKLVYEMIIKIDWTQPTSYGSWGRWIIWEQEQNGEVQADQMGLANNGGSPYVEARSKYGSSSETIKRYEPTQFYNAFHHVVIVHDILVAGTDSIKLYLDGVLVTSTYAVRYADKPLVLGSGILWILSGIGSTATKGAVQHYAIYADLTEIQIKEHAFLAAGLTPLFSRTTAYGSNKDLKLACEQSNVIGAILTYGGPHAIEITWSWNAGAHRFELTMYKGNTTTALEMMDALNAPSAGKPSTFAVSLAPGSDGSGIFPSSTLVLVPMFDQVEAV